MMMVVEVMMMVGVVVMILMTIMMISLWEGQLPASLQAVTVSNGTRFTGDQTQTMMLMVMMVMISI